jgi:hypothetical protein
MRARSKLTESAKVAQRAFRESSKDSNGERENDVLNKALQTK